MDNHIKNLHIFKNNLRKIKNQLKNYYFNQNLYNKEKKKEKEKININIYIYEYNK